MDSGKRFISVGGPDEVVSAGADRFSLGWTVGSVLVDAWSLTTANAGRLIAAALLYLVYYFGSNAALGLVAAPIRMELAGPTGENAMAAEWIVGVVVGVVNFGFSAFVSLGYIRFGLQIARGGPPDFGLLVSGWGRWATAFAVKLAVVVGTLLGAVACYVPGIIISVGLTPASYFAADTKLDVFECVDAAWRATDGCRFRIFLLGLALGLVNLLGLLALGVGLLVTLPMSGLAYCLLHLHLSGREYPEWNAPHFGTGVL